MQTAGPAALPSSSARTPATPGTTPPPFARRRRRAGLALTRGWSGTAGSRPPRPCGPSARYRTITDRPHSAARPRSSTACPVRGSQPIARTPGFCMAGPPRLRLAALVSRLSSLVSRLSSLVSRLSLSSLGVSAAGELILTTKPGATFTGLPRPMTGGQNTGTIDNRTTCMSYNVKTPANPGTGERAFRVFAFNLRVFSVLVLQPRRLGRPQRR